MHFVILIFVDGFSELQFSLPSNNPITLSAPHISFFKSKYYPSFYITFHPYCLLISSLFILTSSLLPPYFLLTSSLLHPYFMLTSCLLHPYFMLTSSLLHAYFILTSCLLHPYFMLTSSLLHPYFIPSLLSSSFYSSFPPLFFLA